ncbi:Eco29kI family restriction endonuclease [Micromonospora chalcea]|uniref:Eco29kI family restriction endonuclease n=1 Tax=Micromonospora chalcea TaxID=1874 RepID=UPI0023782424|nr:Eco29kI family restriction endonuclease [Micromonospora chalcea]WDQ00019.1 Eco29kI family restriction endonuclease [Micromonospora chalcea]
MPSPSPRARDRRQSLVERLAAIADELQAIHPPRHTATRNALRGALAAEAKRLDQAVTRLDPILRPRGLFDPSAPSTTGRIVALTMIAQQRHPLAALRPFYGAGVYALYYNGPFDAYSPISRTEQPIYVGKADPQDAEAKDAVSQGTRLHRRLNDHRKSIQKATSTLRLEDFECRFLIVQTGYQSAAEEQLIQFFQPIWNNDTKICSGMSKHGDNAETRSNKRSPWDTLHPGRQWADALAEDQKPESLIRKEIDVHFRRVPPHRTLESIVGGVIGDLAQLAPTSFTTAAGKDIPVEADFDENMPNDV